MATKKEEKTFTIVLTPRDEKEKFRLYQVDGHNYTVPCGKPVVVTEYLYNAISISGDLNYGA